MNQRGKGLVSIGFLTYQQEKTVAQAFESLLAQEYSEPVEILVSDDGSTDNTPRILSELISAYSGPHQVRNISGSVNLGLIGNVNRVFELSNGEWVFLAAGDDVSASDRVAKCMEIFRSSPEVMAIHTKVWEIDSRGERLNERAPPVLDSNVQPIDLAVRNSVLIGATGAYARRLYDFFGPVSSPLAFEDLVYSFRATLLGGLYYLNEPLVDYRVDDGLSSNRRYDNKSLRADARLKGAKRAVAVLEQRIRDVQLTQHMMKPTLLKVLFDSLNYRLMTVRFYEDRKAFWRMIFSKMGRHVIRVLFKEVAYQWSKKDLQDR